jgi:hypothetical protein
MTEDKKLGQISQKPGRISVHLLKKDYRGRERVKGNKTNSNTI